MERSIDTLIGELLAANDHLSAAKARAWIELLASDFQASYAKAGYGPQSAEMTEKVIRQWIEGYGAQLHEFAGRNPKYARLLEEADLDSL